MAGWTSRARRTVRAAAALLLLGLGAQTEMREPFGLPTVAAPEGPLWSTWRMLQRQFRVDQATIARCRDEPHACPAPAALQLVNIVEAGRAYEGLARIGNINRAVNLAIRAVSDTTHGSTRDEWTSPLAALAASAGDCKQYAVLKYAALREAGFAAEDLRLVILELKPRPLRHAVVALRHEGRWLVLDNRTLRLVESSEVLGHYQPLYALDGRGVWQFGKREGHKEKPGGAARESGS